MQNISLSLLEKQFNDFSAFIEANDKKSFQSFRTSFYFNKEEGYKESIYQEARETIRNGNWKPGDIGTGRIHKVVSNAIKTKVIHDYEPVNNNLINHWTIKDNFDKFKPSKAYEQLLFDFYKNKGVKNETVFHELLNYGYPYNLIAYLFFIKDDVLFVPISQQKFDQVFRLIGIIDFKTTANASWENYAGFISIIRQVRDFLRTKDKAATLVDAHSFLWILGNQMQSDLNAVVVSQPLAEAIGATINLEMISSETQIIITEEDDELTFPEGKEIFKLHRSKERSGELVDAAKEARLRSDPSMRCDVCDFSFCDVYGDLGAGFIEAHHVFPISELKEETHAKIEDLALVCSNCHRMLHRRRPWLSLSALKQLLNRET